jgi:hypothetical protein
MNSEINTVSGHPFFIDQFSTDYQSFRYSEEVIVIKHKKILNKGYIVYKRDIGMNFSTKNYTEVIK